MQMEISYDSTSLKYQGESVSMIFHASLERRIVVLEQTVVEGAGVWRGVDPVMTWSWCSFFDDVIAQNV